MGIGFGYLPERRRLLLPTTSSLGVLRLEVERDEGEVRRWGLLCMIDTKYMYILCVYIIYTHRYIKLTYNNINFLSFDLSRR